VQCWTLLCDIVFKSVISKQSKIMSG